VCEKTLQDIDSLYRQIGKLTPEREVRKEEIGNLRAQLMLDERKL